jgi:PilZ domain
MDSLRKWREPSHLEMQWLVLYANKSLIGQGTLLTVSHEGCQVAGTMPVAVGMVLKVWISPADRDEALYVKEARVLWMRGHQFWLEFRQVDVQDHQWLINFLESADMASDSKSDASDMRLQPLRRIAKA